MDTFSTEQILAMTAIGESESMGAQAMTETLCTVLNRSKANQKWMGGDDLRAICLAHDQYDCWWPETDNSDRDRIIDIATNNPGYAPYVIALALASQAIAGSLQGHHKFGGQLLRQR